MPASALTPDGFERLWETAQVRELEHDHASAAQAYTALLRLHLQSGRRPKPYVLVRIAQCLFRVEMFSPAGLLLDAVRAMLVGAKDSHGTFLVDLRRSELALLSSNRFRAARVLARARDQHGPLGKVAPEHLNVLEQRLLTLSWPSVTSEERAQAQVDARVMVSRLWASSGQFVPALEMLQRALDDTGWQELVYRRAELVLLAAEHHLDRGDLVSTERLITQHLQPPKEAPPLPARDAFRWKVLRARLSCLRGHFGHARQEVTQLLRDSERSPPQDVLQASWSLAQCLLWLNRTQDVEELLQWSQERLPPDGSGRTWAVRFESLRKLMERRRLAASGEVLRPFTPEEAASLRFLDAELPGNGVAAASARGAHTPGPFRRKRERFAEDWAGLANGVMESLEDGGHSQALQALAALERLAARTDSLRLTSRTWFYQGLVAYYRGRNAEAKTWFSQAVEAAQTQGHAFDLWQALGFLAWACARLGETERYAALATRAKTLLDGLVAEMDDADRIFFRLNKWSAQDEYLSALVRAIPREVPAETGMLRRWRNRRRAERSMLDVYRALNCLTGWDVERRLEEGPAVTGEDEPSHASTPLQVEAWVRTHLRMRGHDGAGRARRGKLNSSPWLLWRIPRSVAVLHFYVMADRTLVFVLGQHRIELHTLPLTREQLWRCAMEVLNEIPLQVMPRLRSAEPVDRSLRALSSALQLEQLLGGLPPHVERLVIIPHDVIANLPFPALFLGEARLCERFACSLMPHLGWLSPREHGQARPLKVRRFLGVGISTYAGENLMPLPGADDEPGALASLTSASDAVLLKNEEAHQASVSRMLESAEWAHLACHGRFEPEAPHRACFYLGREAGRSSTLSLAQIQRLRLDRLRLAVLSSCWSSSASFLPGNELVCIPAAFLRAGASAVVGSLWEVDNAMALPFMKEAYAEIARHGVAEGLARAQRRWLRESASPEQRAAFFWAGFLAYGNG
jgi:tetratricopeptide (TPR) repeat protein